MRGGGWDYQKPRIPRRGGRDPSTPYTGTPRLLGSRCTKDPQERGFPEVPVDVPYRPVFRVNLHYLGTPFFREGGDHRDSGDPGDSMGDPGFHETCKGGGGVRLIARGASTLGTPGTLWVTLGTMKPSH